MTDKIIPNILKEFRCNTCKRLLFKGMLIEGAIEVKCKNCHEFTTATANSSGEFFCAAASACPTRAKFSHQ